MLHDSESWLTYAEAGELLGISAEAARQKARRHKWPRRTPNTYGSLAQVQVPLNAVHPAVNAVQDRLRTASYGVQNGGNGVQSGPERGTADSRDRPYDQPDILVHFEQTLDALRQLLGIANRRADDDRARADKAEQELAALRAELVELRISQQAASDIAEYATGEVGNLRKRLDASDQRASRAETRIDEEWTRAELAEKRVESGRHRINELEAELIQAWRRRSWWPWRRR
jgi:hypothetical protein